MRSVVVVIGPGQIGQAIARRVGVGKHLVLADMREGNATAAAEVLGNAGYDVSVATVDASSRDAVRALVETATSLGEVTGLIHAAGVSPSQASPATILKVDLYGTALVLEKYAVWDATVSRAIVRGFNAFVAVENILDTEFDTARTPIRSIGWPRTVRVGARISWQ